MADIILTITNAGLDALVDAQAGVTDAIRVSEIGVSATAVDVAPTLEALPEEIKRITSFAGASVSETIIHMAAQDPSADAYTVRTIGLFLDDGTLFAVYSNAEALFAKLPSTQFLFAIDIAFEADVSADITFGDASFLWPPATETIKGVAEIATQAEVNTGTDDERIVTPKKLKALIDALQAALQGSFDDLDADLTAALTALLARTITGGGLVTGGGDLTASRVLSVAAASGAEVLARALDSVAVTPLGLASLLTEYVSGGVLVVQIGNVVVQAGSGSLAGDGSTTVTFPVAYASDCKFIACGNDTDISNEGNCGNTGNSLTQGSITNNGNPTAPYTWIAWGLIA